MRLPNDQLAGTIASDPSHLDKREGRPSVKRPRPILLLTAFLICCASAHAADLSKIDRTIKKEPVYKNKPRYCLLVFGPEAKTTMWLVLDGDVLHVDSNGDGDLTQSGRAVTGETEQIRDNSDPAYPLQEVHNFSVGDATTGGTTYSKVEIRHTVLKKQFDAMAGFGKEMARLLKKDPGLTRLGIQVRRGKLRIQAVAYAADSREKAPIVHIDGPLTLRPFDVFGLVRGSKAFEFYAEVGTQGLGEDAFATLDYDEIPESAKPLLEIEFPGTSGKVSVSLGRC
jgi:hypothetical protein